MGKAFMRQSYSETSIKDATLTPDKAPQGEVFYNNMGRQIGQLPEQASVSKTLENGETITLPKGIYDSDSVIKSKTVQEVAGDGDLTPDCAEEGKVFYNNQGRQVGELPVQESVNETLSNGDSLELLAGIYKDSSFIQVVSLMDMTKDANAVAETILSGSSAYVNGVLVNGSMPDNSKIDSNGIVPGISTEYPSVPTREGGNLQMKEDVNGVMRLSIGVPRGFYPSYASSYVNRPASEFGNAVVDKVLKGNTFTSEAGLNIEGTMRNLTGESPIEFATGNATKVIVADTLFENTNTDGVERLLLRYAGENGFITGNTLFGLDVEAVRSALGIVSSKIISGQSILGVSGSAVSGPSLTELARSTSSSSDSDSVSSSRFGTYAVLKVYSGHSITADAFIGNVIMKVSDIINGNSYHLFDNNNSVYCAGLNNDSGNVRATKTKNYSYVLYTTNDISAYT